MAIIPRRSLFSWKNVQSKSDLDRLQLVLEALPDEALMVQLEAQRGKGRDDYPVRAIWNSLLAGIVFQHQSVESLRRELSRNGELRDLCGLDPLGGAATVPSSDAYSRFLKNLIGEQRLIEEMLSFRHWFQKAPRAWLSLRILALTDGRQALEDLGATPGRSRYGFRPPTDAMPGESDPYAIWVTPRSMGDVIHLAARFVDVPAAHEGLVPPVGLRREVSPLVSSIGVRTSKEKPPFPYRVQHRGYWFYIDETEIQSRMFFEGLVAAYMSRVGSKTAGDEGPQLILPVGGG
jgi:hypothetical protein